MPDIKNHKNGWFLVEYEWDEIKEIGRFVYEHEFTEELKEVERSQPFRHVAKGHN